MNESVGKKKPVRFQGPTTSMKLFLGIHSVGICQDRSAKVKYRLLNLVPHTMKKEAQCLVDLFGLGSQYIPHSSVLLQLTCKVTLYSCQSQVGNRAKIKASAAILGCITSCFITWAI